jgi:energy-coupling factor transporter transmembrane protein EcfT
VSCVLFCLSSSCVLHVYFVCLHPVSCVSCVFILFVFLLCLVCLFCLSSSCVLRVYFVCLLPVSCVFILFVFFLCLVFLQNIRYTRHRTKTNKTLGTQDTGQINVRENRRGSQIWTNKRNWQHKVHKTQDKDNQNKKHNTEN